MDLKKSGIGVLFLSLVTLCGLFSTDACAEEHQWKLMGRTKDGHYFQYYDPASVRYLSKGYVRFRLKKELTEEGLVAFRKSFYDSVKEAEAKSGSKVENQEPLLKALEKRETKEFYLEMDCARNELRVPPADNNSQVHFTIVDQIESGTAMAKIRDEVCRKD